MSFSVSSIQYWEIRFKKIYNAIHQAATLQRPYYIRHFIVQHVQSPEGDNAMALMEFALAEYSLLSASLYVSKRGAY